MGYLTNLDKIQCFGCGACAQVCPKQAVAMTADNEGFAYPVIDSTKCVECTLCRKVCPAENEQAFRLPEKTFALVQKEEILEKSSSGGAFYTLLGLLPENAVVYGVTWENRSTAVHRREPVHAAFEAFRKSKYVQSRIGNTFLQTKKDLENGLSVMFVGTPCQIAGLRQYLGKEYENLLTVDLICHGVPSAKVLEMYLKDVEKKNDPIQAIEFRHKKLQKGVWNSKYALLNFASGKEKPVEYDTSAFLRGYDNGLFFRPSCSTCLFARKERVSDITIGDFWGAKQAGLDVHKGTSLVFCNTDNGLRFCENIADYAEIYDVNFAYAVANNARLKAPDKGNAHRNEFFERMEKGQSFSRVVQEYAPRVPTWKKAGHAVKTVIFKQ